MTADLHQERLAAGVRLLNSGRHREAEEVFRHILRQSPADADAICALAGAALARNAPQEAFDILVPARALHPNHAGILATLAAVHQTQGRLDDALICIEAAVSIAPNEPGHRFARAQILTALNRFKDALDAAEAGLAIAPAMADLLNVKGALLARLGDKARSAATFHAAHQAEPSRAEFAHNLALAVRELGHFKEALDFAERAYLNEPGDVIFRLGFARSLIDLGRLQEAKETVQAALALSPRDLAATDLLATLHILTGEEDKGLALCANLVRQTNQSGAACLVLAHNLRLAGRLEQALTALPQAKADAKTEAAAKLLETEIRLGLGRYDEALADRDPTNDVVKNFIVSGAGFGEACLCARWLTEDMTLHVPADLAPLFAAFSKAKVVTTTDENAGRLFALITPDRLPPPTAAEAYLHLPEAAVKPWTDALRNLPAPRVGILWDHAAPGLDLAKLTAALEGTGTLVALAGDPLRHDLQGFPQIRDGGVNIQNIYQLAGAVAALDFVVTPDSIVAHLAGALGKPGIVLVAAGHPWYWRAEDTHAVWYPSLDVIKQTRAGDWDAALVELQARLAPLVARLAPSPVS